MLRAPISRMNVLDDAEFLKLTISQNWLKNTMKYLTENVLKKF